MAAEDTKTDDEVEIEITDDKPEGGDNGAPEIKKIVTPEEGVEELKAKLAEQQKQTEQERIRRQQAERQRDTATVEKEDSDLGQINAAIGTVKQRLEVARGNYRTARTGGDVDAELEANEVILQAKVDLVGLENAKAIREQAKKNPQPRAAQHDDPAEAFAIGIEGNSPRSAAWVRSHPDFARDPAKLRKMIAASDWALSNGHAADTDSYFAEVEKMLGIQSASSAAVTVTKNNEDPSAEAPMSSASRPVAPPSAPVSRNGAGPGQPRPGVIRLSREQAEMAEASFPDLKPADAHRAYAKNMADLRAAGRLN